MRYLRHNGWLFLLLALLTLMPVYAYADNARAILNNSVSKIRSGGTVSLTFNITSDGHAMKGAMKVSGNKFAISSPASNVWYDGRSMWTYSSSTRETTLTTPTSSELAQINPMLYLGAGDRFDVKSDSSSPSGTYSLILTPKGKKEGVKNVKILINKSTSLPSKIVITPKSGGAVTLTVGSIRVGEKMSNSTFTYPKSKYPNVKIVDLR